MKTSQNYQRSEGFVNELASLTVPDQSLTLRELLTNYTRGNDLPQANTNPAFFDEDSFIPNLKKMDLVELQELAQDNAKKAQDSVTHLNNLRNNPPPPKKTEEGGTAPEGAKQGSETTAQ